ncbi:MAG: divalent-cation tolerance protein CutA [Candidatus Caenarcaniphilales bacterium]|nr:divalent-cation tolerance protein CutA [Candidatus Caenarcaniphilales bacterium]
MTKINLLYCPCHNHAEAEKIGKALLEAKLVACVNILDGIASLYWWEGKIQKDSEVLLLAKTSESHNKPIEEKISELHSYNCPCIAFFEVARINDVYKKWLNESLKS